MADLIEKWQSGDMSAFEALFQQYQRLVFKTAYLMSGSREEAEDVLQDVFVTVWKSSHTFNPAKGKLTTWLHRITVNQCMSKHRKKQAPTFSLEKARMDGFDLVETRNSELPEELALSRLEYERLIKAMNSLNGKHRPVLVLRYFNDLSYNEIAQVLDIPLGTVKSRINQALKSLRGQLGIQQREASIGKKGGNYELQRYK